MSDYHYIPGRTRRTTPPRKLDTTYTVLLLLLLSVFVSYVVLYMWVWAVR